MANSTMVINILIVDDEERIRSILELILKEHGFQVEVAQNGLEAIDKCNSFDPQVLIVDLQMPGLNGMETILKIREKHPQSLAIILTAYGTIQSAVEAIKKGAYDYITKPFDNDHILAVVRRAVQVFELTQQVDRLKNRLQIDFGINSILGRSEIMDRVRQQILQMACTDATILIEGESGTGKELAARALHYESNRKSNPFVVIDCAALPPNLIESEFFGHEKGAFTDAKLRKSGKFEEAHMGTIFLDEIGELPLEAQVKLLRVLQEKQFTRVGGTTPIQVDVRIISATNKNLQEEVLRGSFRKDLYYRINVLRIHMPPLREHLDDIPIYADHFVRKYATTFGKRIRGVSQEVTSQLRESEWNGNIRELENVIQRGIFNSTEKMLLAEDISSLSFQGGLKFRLRQYNRNQSLTSTVRTVIEATEKEIIRESLRRTGWNRSSVARVLKISRKTLFNKMQKYGLLEKGGTSEMGN